MRVWKEWTIWARSGIPRLFVKVNQPLNLVPSLHITDCLEGMVLIEKCLQHPVFSLQSAEYLGPNVDIAEKVKVSATCLQSADHLELVSFTTHNRRNWFAENTPWYHWSLREKSVNRILKWEIIRGGRLSVFSIIPASANGMLCCGRLSFLI